MNDGWPAVSGEQPATFFLFKSFENLPLTKILPEKSAFNKGRLLFNSYLIWFDILNLAANCYLKSIPSATCEVISSPCSSASRLKAYSKAAAGPAPVITLPSFTTNSLFIYLPLGA